MSTDEPSFDNLYLSDNIQRGIFSAGFETPLPSQWTIMKTMMTGSDLIFQSPSGTGKSLAYGVALLQRMDLTKHEPQALIITVTREAAIQLQQLLLDLGKFHLPFPSANIVCVTGGTSVGEDVAKFSAFQDHRFSVKSGKSDVPMIVIGTVGRLQHLLLTDPIIPMRLLKCVVLDDCDELVTSPSCQQDVLGMLRSLCTEAQIVAVSATFCVKSLSILKKEMKVPIVSASSQGTDLKKDSALLRPSSVSFSHLSVKNSESLFELLLALPLPQKFQSVFFFNSVTKAEQCLKYFAAHKPNISISLLTHNLSPVQRQKEITNFLIGNTKVLFSTDIAARGLDLRHVQSVVNCEIPFDAERVLDEKHCCEEETKNNNRSVVSCDEIEENRAGIVMYIHRAGRCGRFQRAGQVIDCVPTAKVGSHVTLLQDRFNVASIPLLIDAPISTTNCEGNTTVTSVEDNLPSRQTSETTGAFHTSCPRFRRVVSLESFSTSGSPLQQHRRTSTPLPLSDLEMIALEQTISARLEYCLQWLAKATAELHQEMLSEEGEEGKDLRFQVFNRQIRLVCQAMMMIEEGLWFPEEGESQRDKARESAPIMTSTSHPHHILDQNENEKETERKSLQKIPSLLIQKLLVDNGFECFTVEAQLAALLSLLAMTINGICRCCCHNKKQQHNGDKMMVPPAVLATLTDTSSFYEDDDQCNLSSMEKEKTRKQENKSSDVYSSSSLRCSVIEKVFHPSSLIMIFLRVQKALILLAKEKNNNESGLADVPSSTTTLQDLYFISEVLVQRCREGHGDFTEILNVNAPAESSVLEVVSRGTMETRLKKCIQLFLEGDQVF